ncbi:MAG: hypothetical protein LBJ22_00980 [Synergistaceae bacterium]|nr:hypothetical protein [Synergistaceae bacterium]
MEKRKNRSNRLVTSVLLCAALSLGASGAVGAATFPLPVTGAAGIGMDNPTLQARIAEMEFMRLSQIKNALLSDFWTKSRILKSLTIIRCKNTCKI